MNTHHSPAPSPHAGDVPSAALRRMAIRFVILVGVLSFFADFTYEGARSISGPYLASLQASATIVATVAGFGELLGYGLRLLSGRWADSTGSYWSISIAGYLLQMSAVPALALTHSWQAAAALLIAERIGKAVRNPPRDAMLSHAGHLLGGYGWTFGIHEALDQLGALFGPLLVAAVLAHQGSYHNAFALLLFPAIINIMLVLLARRLYPQPQNMEPARLEGDHPRLGHIFWVYLAAAALVAAGFADYPLLAYHFSRQGLASNQHIALFYAAAMAVSGSGSLLFGRLFDRYGFAVLVWLTPLCAAFAPLVFLGGERSALAGAIIWGLGMGVHESLIPAAVAPLVAQHRRASAFGLFTAGYGLFWFLGSVAIGALYETGPLAATLFCVVAELTAVPLLIWVWQQLTASSAPQIIRHRANHTLGKAARRRLRAHRDKPPR